jgi:hypothetical protein
MKFLKNILVIDFEGVSGEPTQIGAVLLDKESLEEKDSFCSYIYMDMKGQKGERDNITQEMLIGAPSQAEVGKMVFDKFGTDIFLASWVARIDYEDFNKIIMAANIDKNLYDYHFFDIWPITYAHLAKRGYDGPVNSDPLFREFGIKQREYHDALADARIAASILRKIMLD